MQKISANQAANPDLNQAKSLIHTTDYFKKYSDY
jgi:hypothetical protein